MVTFWTYTMAVPFGWLLSAALTIAWRHNPLTCARRLQRLQVLAYRFMHWWFRISGITDFDPNQSIPGLPNGPCVIVANHPTLMDITAITAAVGGGCTIVKPALFRRRMMHFQLAAAGHVEGPGPDLMSIGRVLDEVGERLASGFRVIVFPEGTRSPPDRLLPFGRIAFEIACRAKVPLVSLTITCRPLFLGKNVPLFWLPDTTPRLRIGLLAVDHPEPAARCSRRLRATVETRYQAWLSTLVPPSGVT